MSLMMENKYNSILIKGVSLPKILIIFLVTFFLVLKGGILPGFEVESAKASQSFEAITSPEDFDKIRENPWGNFVLLNDIDMAGVDFEPMGYPPDEYRDHDNFNGSLDGNGYKIKNLTIESSQYDYQGFFAALGRHAVISDLTLENVTIEGDSFVGGLVGTNKGTIENIRVDGEVTGYGYGIGIVAGVNKGKISDSSSLGSVSGNSRVVGGLVGSNPGEIEYSSSEARVYGSDKFVGGLTGRNKGRIYDSYAKGDVEGKERYVGGLTGENSAYIYGSHAQGRVLGAAKGGIAGGLAGENTGRIERSYACGTVRGNYYIGGLVGVNEENGTVLRSRSFGWVNGYEDGIRHEGSLTGGLVAKNLGRIDKGFGYGNVRGEGKIGGLVGVNHNHIVNSYSNNTKINGVDGNESAGGLAGRNKGEISTSYAVSEVSGQNEVGGFVGYNIGVIDTSYAASALSGGDYTGTFAGRNRSGGDEGQEGLEEKRGEINNSIALQAEELDFASNYQYDLGEETMCREVFFSDLKKRKTFTDLETWDFDDKWKIREGETFPYLRGVSHSIPQKTDLIHR